MTCGFFQRSKVACAAVIVLTAAQAPIAQQRQTADVFGMAHALLKVFYPSLLRQQLYFGIVRSEVENFDGPPTPLMHFGVVVIKPAPADPRHPENRDRDILTGFMDFDFDGQLKGWHLRSDSEFSNGDRRRQLEAQLGQNMSDAQVDAILSGAGVRYGLNSEKEFLVMVQSLLARLEPLIGKKTIVSTEFQPKNQSLVWGVEIQGQGAQSAFGYKFSFEALEGKLIAIYR